MGGGRVIKRRRDEHHSDRRSIIDRLLPDRDGLLGLNFVQVSILMWAQATPPRGRYGEARARANLSMRTVVLEKKLQNKNSATDVPKKFDGEQTVFVAVEPNPTRLRVGVALAYYLGGSSGHQFPLPVCAGSCGLDR
jgi:hypothetical protein